MVQAKVQLFDNETQNLAEFFKVLSHPARLSILKYLAKCKSCITGDITNELPLGRTTVLQHLKELKEFGLIIGEIEGVKVNYCINENFVQENIDLISLFFNKISCCDEDECK